MKASDIKKLIKSLYPIKRTICIESEPGSGKTSVVQQVANDLMVPIKLIHLPTALVEDFGIPYPTENSDSFEYKMPYWWPSDDEPEGIMLFDDRNQASTDLQKVLANICQERHLHGRKLPDGWMIISTGNRAEDKAGVGKILTHLRNRETVINYDVNLKDWTEWAISNSVLAEVIGFINFRPELLNKFDPDASVNPTPRSWADGVDKVIRHIPREMWLEVISGAVGEGAATEFIGYLKVVEEMEDLDDLLKKIIKDPKNTSLPDNVMFSYAVVSGLAYRANKDNLQQLITYVERISREFVTLMMLIAKTNDPKIVRCEAYIEYLVVNQDVVL